MIMVWKAQTQRQTQTKEIIVTKLDYKKVTPKMGQTFKEFTSYTIQGNDGINYETMDEVIFKSAEMGKTLKVEFYVESKNVNGRIWTHYKIQSPPKPYGGGGAKLEDIVAAIKDSEGRIMSFIKKEVLGISEPIVAESSMADHIDDGDEFSDSVPFDKPIL